MKDNAYVKSSHYDEKTNTLSIVIKVINPLQNIHIEYISTPSQLEKEHERIAKKYKKIDDEY